MNNKPVAWMLVDEINGDYMLERYPSGDYEWIPLYTHPVKELDEQFKKGFEAGKEEGWKANKYHHSVKELTDEEILQFQDKVPYTLGSDLIKFARAILKKAQEQ